MLEKTVAELSKALRSREVSSVELTQAYLEKIATVNERLNTYITTCDELALKQASKADRLIADGNQNPLLGIPVAHKDIFCTKNIKQPVVLKCSKILFRHTMLQSFPNLTKQDQ